MESDFWKIKVLFFVNVEFEWKKNQVTNLLLVAIFLQVDRYNFNFNKFFFMWLTKETSRFSDKNDSIFVSYMLFLYLRFLFIFIISVLYSLIDDAAKMSRNCQNLSRVALLETPEVLLFHDAHILLNLFLYLWRQILSITEIFYSPFDRSFRIKQIYLSIQKTS